MAVTMYKFTCKMCGVDFEKDKRNAVFCGMVCSGANAGRAPSKQVCKCGAPAGKKGNCVECAKEAKRASRLRAKLKHQARWNEVRKERYASDPERKRKMRKMQVGLRFNGLRDNVLARDGYKCRRCGTGEKLVVHHEKRRIDREKADRDSQMEDLITLCRRCHINLHREAGDLKPARDYGQRPLPLSAGSRSAGSLR